MLFVLKAMDGWDEQLIMMTDIRRDEQGVMTRDEQQVVMTRDDQQQQVIMTRDENPSRTCSEMDEPGGTDTGSGLIRTAPAGTRSRLQVVFLGLSRIYSTLYT
jgi:hypothetical protein